MTFSVSYAYEQLHSHWPPQISRFSCAVLMSFGCHSAPPFLVISLFPSEVGDGKAEEKKGDNRQEGLQRKVRKSMHTFGAVGKTNFLSLF